VLEELKLRNYSQATAHTYVEAIRRYAEYFHLSPQQLGREHIRQYQLHLIEERKLEPKSVMVQMTQRSFSGKVLRRIESFVPAEKAFLPRVVKLAGETAFVRTISAHAASP
jgi:cytoskeletal protein RodZ